MSTKPKSTLTVDQSLRVKEVARGVARRHGLQDSDCDDIASETFLAVAIRIRDASPPDNLDGLAAGIAQHKCIDHYRSKRVRRCNCPPGFCAQLAEGASPDQAADKALPENLEACEFINAWLTVLDEQVREVVLARLEGDDMTFERIARLMGVTFHQIRQWWSEAIGAARKLAG